MTKSRKAKLDVDDLSLVVRRSAKRQSLEIVINRDGSLRIAAPVQTSTVDLERFVRDKRMWIYRKLAHIELTARPSQPKEFVPGEGFLYLGRNYRLALVDRQDKPLKLMAGKFRLLRRETSRGPAHFVRWYAEHGKEWLGLRVASWANRMDVEPIQLTVRELGYRWGSCGTGKKLNFHWAVVTLPPSIIDYVIVHELAHIEIPTHGKTFWARVGRTMPDYDQRKVWLAEHGHAYATL